MTPCFRLALVFALLSLAAPCAAQTRSGRRQPAGAQSAPGAFTGGAARSFLRAQKKLTKEITGRLDSIKTGADPAALGLLLGAAFLYGLLHALGPGHGKLIVASWFGANKSRWWHAPVMGFEIAALHVLSAVALVYAVDNLSRYVFGRGRESGLYAVQLVSYGAITLIGAFLLWRTRRENRMPQAAKGPPGARSRLLLALSVGVVPCAGALLILFYALSQEMLFTGIAVVAAMAAGIGLTLSVVGAVCIAARNGLAARSISAPGSGPAAPLLRYAGAALITAVGAALFITAL